MESSSLPCVTTSDASVNSDCRSGEYNSLIPVLDPSSSRIKFPSVSNHTLVMVGEASAIATGKPPKVEKKPLAFGWTIIFASGETLRKIAEPIVGASP